MRIQLLLAAILIIITTAFRSDKGKTYPKDFFTWPVKHSIRLSGTFGELRPNHFHAGVDIKTSRGRAGDPLYAAGAGHVSRIKVDASGYGRVLYIDHPNGYTTVYAHMHEFNEELEAFIKEQQFKQQQFEVELFPQRDRFVYEQGDFIGKIGNTGSSMGAHLHFEIRDTYSENPINPLLFGLDIADRRPPRLHQLKVYGFSSEDQEVESKIYSVRRKDGGYAISGDTIYMGSDRVGLALKAYDHHDNVKNWNGIYGMKMDVEDQLAYQFTMESFSFEETRYINAHMDFQDRLLKRSYFNRCFTLPGNELSIYDEVANRGVIEINKKKAKKVTFRVWDIDGNATFLTCWVKRGSKDAQAEKRTYNYWLHHDEEHLLQSQGCRLHFPVGSLYEDLAMDFQVSDDASSEYYSPVFHLHDHLTPIHKYFDISIKPNRTIPADKLDKAFIAYCTTSGKVYNSGGTWNGNRLEAKANVLGDYAIMLDETPPTITNRSFKYDLRGRNYFTLRVEDNFETSRLVEDMEYSATIDGAWVLVEYDKKYDQIRHYLSDDLPRGEHVFRLEVRDPVGNLAVFEKKFRR